MQKLKAIIFLMKYRSYTNNTLIGQEGLSHELVVPLGLPVSHLKLYGKVKITTLNIEKNFDGFDNRDIEESLSCPSGLILEPPNLTKNLLVILRLKILELIKTHSVEKVYIKLHPSQKYSLLSHQILNIGNLDVSVVNSDLPAEILYRELSPKFVLSTNSSALLNIKCFFPESFVYGIGASFEENDLLEIKAIFMDSGVNIV
jgi:hypothetical protein